MTGYRAGLSSGSGKAAPHIGRESSAGQTEVTREIRSLERLSDLGKGTQPVNTKGGIWNSAASLRNHSVSSLTGVNPMLTAHPSATSLAAYWCH